MVVAASGNESKATETAPVGFPANCATVFAVAAVDGRLMTVHGESLGDQRYPGPAARLSELWAGLQKRFEDILDGVTLADLLADDPPEPAVSLLRDAALSA